jgi:outer membrane protein OmpA-like peptidoglycan-associated protein
MHNKLMILAVTLILVLGGCAGMDQSQRNRAQGTAIGTGVGAASGAAIGALAGDTGIGAAIGAGVGALGGYVWSGRMENQKKQMEAATEGTDVSVTQTEDNRLKLNIPSDISFDTGRADIKPEMYPVLNTLADGLKNNPNTHVPIIGHTDDTDNDRINNPLSVNCAASTRDYLVSRGIQINRISIDGHGSRDPMVANDTSEHRAMNRRVEIFVKEPQQQPEVQQQQQQQYQPPEYRQQQPQYQPPEYQQQPQYLQPAY